ncbi:YicC/YloC family endoribonuclease [Kaistella polysaccharea]|uniref:YicC/YloC family endoribonuclease n=1 Tax=Kaistella polysaccharea TaxID=2878534 RepID=UPI001CF56310|nr:YicC/YloC family endoribonuclease [Kaistella polysaccharea]
MILSMTGFGRSEGVYEGKKITVDLKSLNSKSFDLNIKIPFRYKEKEYDLRKLLNDRVQRGKVDCYVNIESLDDASETTVNQELVSSYISELKKIAADGPEFEYLKMAIRMPDAISAKSEELTEEEWNFLLGLVKGALQNFENFRQTEGKILQDELQRNINNIKSYLAQVEPFEHIRMDSVKERYRNSLSEFDQLDETRFYQEMAYYTEKLDIAEEKVRLTQHLKYYEEVMQQENLNGKKLGFISQEIGREINTLGSKANHAEIQKLVVMMKDDLEKIKEQTLNVL